MTMQTLSEQPSSRISPRRVALAAVAASFGCLFPLVLTAMFPMLLRGDGFGEALAATGQFTVHSLLLIWPVALFVSAVVAISVYYWLKRNRASRPVLLPMLLAGFGIGAIAASLFWLFAWDAPTLIPVAGIIGAAMGGAAALSFWAVMRS